MIIERTALPAAIPAGLGGAIPASAGAGAAAGAAAPSAVSAGAGGAAVPFATSRLAAGAAVLSAMLAGLGGTAPSAAGPQPPPAVPGRARPAPEAVGDQRPNGGRDPFVRPTAPEAPGPVGARPSGVAGLAVDEAVVRGVVVTRAGRLAMLEGPGARTWVVRRGDRLHDGAVHDISADAVVFLRDAADAVPFAERVVRLRLRDTEGGR